MRQRIITKMSILPENQRLSTSKISYEFSVLSFEISVGDVVGQTLIPGQSAVKTCTYGKCKVN